MVRGTTSEIALGVPGQIDGRATLQSDRGDETQALFMYQWSVGVILLVGALASNNSYVAVWCEHHDDLLGELPDGKFHAIQVKTSSTVVGGWTCGDRGFLDAIRKFAAHEAVYPAQVELYIFYSNVGPYVPASTATKASTLASSPMRLRDECRKANSHNAIPSPYKESFDALVAATGAETVIVFRVFQKLEFQKGVPLENYREHLRNYIGGISQCSQFTLHRLAKLRDELLFLIGEASSLSVPSIDFYSSVLQSDGRPEATVRGKRVSVDDVEIKVKQHPGGGFRYADVGGCLQLGSASGQKDVLRKKMVAGYVGGYFSAMWLQAISAEQRLLEQASVDPEGALRKAKQLQSLMLVECQTAEAAAALEPDERRRGALILQRIIQRTEDLAQHDGATVENERAETLRGIAGLLSGSCHFAWGNPVEGGEDGA